MTINRTIIKDLLGSEIRLSSVKQLETTIPFKSFSAKYVVEGKETYVINNKQYKLSKGEYVAGNKHSLSSVLIDSKEPVKGLCLDISAQVLQEVIDFNFKPASDFANHLLENELIISKYNVSNTNLGYAINQIVAQYDQLLLAPENVNQEIFYTIAECIVLDQSQIQKAFANLSAAKPETNKRLFNFLHETRDYIDKHFLDQIQVNQLAKEARLSEYHFIRLFKQVFQITPYQYLLKKRLDYSKICIMNKEALQDIAILCGFADFASYSKAFKAHFGIAPGRFRNESKL